MAFVREATALASRLGRFPKGQTERAGEVKEATDGKTKVPKKEHELACLVPFVGNTCSRLGLQHVVDLGCGKGYISHELAIRCASFSTEL